MLASGADAGELREPLHRARAAGLAGAALAELEQATMLALRLHAVLTAHRRREDELAALFDTASDLAARRDLDSVLHSIVRRARKLLGSDVAYLTLNDDRVYMRVADGTVSALFRQAKPGMCEELAGLVARTAQPHVTANYRTDKRFKQVDAVVDEGLVAVLGVPLRLGEKVIGVLLAADRSERTFSTDEVSLLYALATHAAIAIDAADQCAQGRAALDELHTARTTITGHTAAMRRAEGAHDLLTQLVQHGRDIREITEAVGRILGAKVAAFDPDGDELAGAGTWIAPPAAEALTATRVTGRVVSDVEEGPPGRWVCAVLAGQELLGTLVLEGRAELAGADRRLFERSAAVAALLLLRHRSAAEAEDQARRELLVDLLSADGQDPAELAARGRRLGVDLSRPHVVLVARIAGCSRQRVAAMACRLAFGHGLGGEFDGDAVLLLAGYEPGEQAKWAGAELARQAGQPVTVGAGGPAHSIGEILDARVDALRCVDALVALGRGGEAASAADLGFLGLVLGGRDAHGFVRATIGPVIEYDERRGTELVRTLDAYFANGTNLNATKQALRVHVNTVVQRLERIAALLGKNWNSPDNALEVQLALKLHRIGQYP